MYGSLYTVRVDRCALLRGGPTGLGLPPENGEKESIMPVLVQKEGLIGDYGLF